MNNRINTFRLWLSTFSGEDAYIINDCNVRLQNNFAFIGATVILIFAMCFASAVFFVLSIFHSPIACIFVGFIWAALITNLYLLLLYTITPPILPVAEKRKIQGKFIVAPKSKMNDYGFYISLILRVSLIILLAIIIMQPINLFIFFPDINSQNELAKLLHEVSTKPLAWIYTTIGCGFFLTPVYIKFLIRNKSEFYEKKRRIETEFIKDTYLKFKETYSEIFEKVDVENKFKLHQKINNILSKYPQKMPLLSSQIVQEILTKFEHDRVVKYEYWADPPFRTTKKEVFRKLNSEQEFIADMNQTTN